MAGPKRKIKAKKIARDVKDGMGDYELMDKYRLSREKLDEVLRRLVEAGWITEMQLFERSTLTDSAISKAFDEARAALGGDID